MKNIIIILFLVLIQQGYGQWEKCNNGVLTTSVHSFAEHEDFFLAGTIWGFYLSPKDKISWAKNLLVKDTLDHISVIEVNKNNIVLGSDRRGLHLSTNSGFQWKYLRFAEYTILSVSIMDNNLTIVVQLNTPYTTKVFSSSDMGGNWIEIVKQGVSFNKVKNFNENILATTNKGVYISSDKGVTWKEFGLNNIGTRDIVIVDTTIYVSSSDKIYKTSNNGQSWNCINLNDGYWSIESFVVYESNLIACVNGNLYVSNDGGTTWSSKIIDRPNFFVRSLYLSGKVIFAVTLQHGIYSSSDFGITWTPQNDGLYHEITRVFGSNEKNIIASCWGSLLYSNDLGKIWECRHPQQYSYSHFMHVDNDTIYTSNTTQHFLNKSTDNGKTWNIILFGDGQGHPGFASFIHKDNDMYVGSLGAIYISHDNGNKFIKNLKIYMI